MADNTFDRNFLDVEIRVLPQRDEGYPVEITLGGQQEFRGVLAADILPWIPSNDLTADGQRLFETLFSDSTLRSAWAEARGQAPQRRIRLRIDPDAAELHALPWEMLQEGPVMLSAQADTPFSRYLPIELPWGEPVEERPIRVLVVISDPTDIEATYGLPRADAELERNTLESAFETVGPGDLQVDFLDPPATLMRLEEKLREGYHILHYQGHGAFSDKQERAVLYMQDEKGLTQLVFDDELAQLLARQGVQPRLVFLAACQSATRSTGDAFLGMAPKLISVGVPAVVAMQDLISVESTLRFSQTFYQRLLEHGQVDLAVNEARSTLLTAKRWDVAAPVLFMRLKSGQLWKDETEEDTGPKRIENLRDLELAYLDGLLKRYEYWRDHYTPLAGITEVRAAVKDGPRLDLPMPFIPPGFEKLTEHGYGPQAKVRREKVGDLRDAIGEHRRIILLGDPGSGKTTTLWRLAYDYATTAREDAQAPLPALVSLGGYTDNGPVDTYLAHHLGPLAPYLETYRASGRLILLLDGLNEMPQADYTERVGHIQDVLDRYPDETTVVTCRALDYVVELKQLQKVEVSPLDEMRIRDFLHNYLGETAGERLFWTMAGDDVRDLRSTWQQADETWERLRKEPPPLLAMGRNPYLLLMTAQVYAGAEGKLPANRAKLFSAFVDTLLGREEKRHPENWIEIERQMEGLSALAYAMQSERGRGTTVEREWAIDSLGSAVPECDAERLLYLASSATLLDADNSTVRFYHQLLQEYFAARHIVSNASQGTIPRLLSHCADDRWREVILLTASLLDVPDDFFVAFQYALDDLVREDERLVKLLDWATRKSAAVTTPFRRAALRSTYCQIALAIARGHTLVESGDIGYSYRFDRTRNQAKDLAHSLGYDHNCDRVPSLDLDFAVSYALTRALTCARPIVRGDRRTFVAAFSKAKAISRENKAHDLYQALSNLTSPKANKPRGEWTDFCRTLESTISHHRDIGQGWRFTREQTEYLEHYLHATQLLVQCLDLAHITDRTAIEDRLLLPPHTQNATAEDRDG